MELICYKKCGTCRKVENILNEKGIEYSYRHIDKDNPSKEEIKDFHERSALDIKKLFNTSGRIYRDLNLKDKLKNMTLEEKYEILSTDGMLVKRPIIITDDNKVLIGKDAREYVENL